MPLLHIRRLAIMSDSIIESLQNFGAQFLYSQGAGGLYDILKHVQTGKLYITGANEVTASGTIDNAFTSAPNTVLITPRVDPSGDFWVSSIAVDEVVVTYETTPAGPAETFPYHVADWTAIF